MRVGWLIAACLVAGVPAFADDAPPSLDAAIAQAARENKPLVIELGATWCSPCRYFEQKVLPRGDVQEALELVVFVRYDIDVPPGDVIAKQLGVVGVPAFLALDLNGKVTARHVGISFAKDAHFPLLELIAQAQRAHAGWSELIEDTALAAAKRDEVIGREERIANAVTRAEQFVSTYPDSDLSSVRLAALALSGRVTLSRLHALAKLHLDAVADVHWPEAVRAALLARANDLARDSIEEHLQRDPNAAVPQLMRAEASLVPGGPNYSFEIGDACGSAGNELWCFLLRQKSARRGGLPAGTASLRERAQRYVETMDAEGTPSDVSVEDLGAIDVRFGNSVGEAFANARLDCGYLARYDTTAFVALELMGGGHPRAVRVKTGGGAELERCIRKRIASALLEPPPPELRNHVHGSIVFDVPGDREPQYRMPPRAGVMPQLLVRLGAIETYGFRGDFLVGTRGRDRRGLPPPSLLAGATLELAGADTGDPAYVARARVGAMTPFIWNRNVVTMLLVGAGVSDLGTGAPRAFEVPVEARLRVELGTTRIHAWAEQTLYAWGRESNGFISYGGGVSFELAGRRLFLGAAYEERIPGASAMFTFGVPLGDIY